jgi:hypothetical protein
MVTDGVDVTLRGVLVGDTDAVALDEGDDVPLGVGVMLVVCV